MSPQKWPDIFWSSWGQQLINLTKFFKKMFKKVFCVCCVGLGVVDIVYFVQYVYGKDFRIEIEIPIKYENVCLDKQP